MILYIYTHTWHDPIYIFTHTHQIGSTISTINFLQAFYIQVILHNVLSTMGHCLQGTSDVLNELKDKEKLN
jgi:hypothetical protein